MKSIFITISIFIINNLNSQFFVKIQIKDSLSSELISKVEIFSNDSLIGITNNYGYILLESQTQTKYLIFKHTSYIEHKKNIIFNEGILEIFLNPAIYNLNRIIKRSNKNVSSGIEYREISRLPNIFGDKDIFKNLQTLPGVTNSLEGNTGLYIRGGNIDQTSVFIDDAPFYNMSHFYGFFSPIDFDIIKTYSLYKDGLSSSYGGRGSSVLDLRLKEASLNKSNTETSFGFLSNKVIFETPIVKKKISLLTSFRFSNIGILDFLQFNNYFFDGNIKIKYIINSKNIFYFSKFFSKDVYSLENLNEFSIGDFNIKKYEWKNNLNTLRWNNINNKGAFTNMVVSHSIFKTLSTSINNFEPNIENSIKNICFKIQRENIKNFKNFLYGININYSKIKQGVFKYNLMIDSNYISEPIYQNNSIDYVLFGEKKINILQNYAALIKLRTGVYKNISENFDFFIFEPRIEITKHVSKNILSFKFDKTSQFQNYIGSRNVFLPNDFWFNSSKNLKPQIIFSYSFTHKFNFKYFKIENSLFYKDYFNSKDLEDGTQMYRNIKIQEFIINTKSRSYGLEILIKKEIGKFSGILSYTFSRSETISNKINNNNWFASNFDRTNVIHLVTSYDFSKKWSISILNNFQNGTPATILYGYNYLYSKRNEYRLPNYYRTDLSLNKKFNLFKKVKSEFNFSIYNLFNLKNQNSQFPLFETQFASIPIIPSISLKTIF